MKNNNKGMSLIEMIIVLAIMAVFVGGVSLGLRIIFEKPADGCAKKIQAILQNARTTSMGRFGDTVELYTDASNNLYIKETIMDKDGTTSVKPILKVGDNKLTVVAKNGHGAVMTLPVTFEFDRSSGGLKNGADACTELEITGGSRTKYVKISYVTGKISYE